MRRKRAPLVSLYGLIAMSSRRGQTGKLRTSSLLALLGVAGVLAGIALWDIHSAPLLYEGDRLETRSCRVCDGSGRNTDPARQGNACVYCGGDGDVDVIVPGPHRPSRVVGYVHDVKRVDPTFGFPPIWGPGRMDPVPGSVPGARTTFSKPGTNRPIEAITSSTGKFTTLLPPGTWTVKTTAPGYRPHEGTFEVPPLAWPIWIEEADRNAAPKSPEEEQAVYGLRWIIGMERE